MKFKNQLVKNILNNECNFIENIVRAIRPLEKIVIAQGYGAGDQVPSRFLAYAVPVLRLASQLSEMTTVEFYFAAHGVFRANGKYYGQSVSVMRKKLIWLVNNYYPKLSDRVSILEDVPLSEKAQNIIDVLLEPAKMTLENNAQIKQFVSNRGGESALRYMLEHLLYMRDPILVDKIPNRELLVPQMSTSFNHLIMIGGPAEKVFYQFRKEMLKLCGSHDMWVSHQLFTPVGDPPTYHVHSGEPVFDGTSLPNNLFSRLKVLPSEFGKQKNLIRDYSILLQELAEVETFKLPHEIDSIVIQKGLEVLNCS